jgi:hypothetical protein
MGIKIIVFGFFVAICLLGCDAYNKEIDDPYYLIAIDTLSQMSLYYSLPNGNFVGRIDETVFAVGVNEKFIVVQRYPNHDYTNII